jgi:hypothetical protein
VRLVLGDEAGVEYWPRVTFGDWCGVISPSNTSLGRCVHRDAQDAAPAGFSLVDRTEVADVVRLLDDDSSTLRVKGVFGLADDQTRVAVVHDDVYGATLPELAQGDALAGEFYPSGVNWDRRNIFPTMNNHAHLEPTDVLHVIMPVAYELQRWCAAGFASGFGLGHEVHMTLDGAVRFRPFSPRARDRSARVQHYVRESGPGWAVASLVLHAVLSPKKRARFISWPSITQLWPGPIPEDVGNLLSRSASGRSSTSSSLDQLIHALGVLQASLPTVAPDRMAGLVAGLFPGRVAEEERTRDTFAQLDERAFSPHR